MTTKTTTKIIAENIALAALDQGLSVDALRVYDLTADDCDAIRIEYPSDEYPADAVSTSEWRIVMAEVEAAVREYI